MQMADCLKELKIEEELYLISNAQEGPKYA